MSLLIVFDLLLQKGDKSVEWCRENCLEINHLTEASNIRNELSEILASDTGPVLTRAEHLQIQRVTSTLQPEFVKHWLKISVDR